MTVFGARSKLRNGARSSAEEDGGSSGILLSMDMVSTSYYGIAYTVPVLVGSLQQNLSLQVDTGSSDLWIASESCSSASCSATGGRLYNPSSSQPTGAAFTMQYLSGAVDGPIVWDHVQVGGYNISNQALAAATTVNNEPLANNFDGVLGLALPANSLIQQNIPASTDDTPDGATISSNILSLTPPSVAPSQPFFSLSLARPGFSQVPSVLGIGRHPPQIVSDPSQIRYSSLVSESVGPLFWKTTVRAITVYVNGQANPVTLQSLSGASEPTALLDSGVPLIITTPALANGIYGALGIDPASDGNYYVPCATPVNMTITLDGQNELPLHPLDLTAEPAGQTDSQYCTGLIQADPSQLTATPDIGDIILGVPFMRNVYTVMAYEQPDSNGNFNNSVQLGTQPTLGLLGLTNITEALQEFNQVRVSKQPPGSGSSQQSVTSESGGLSVGIKVLIGLGGFFVLCLALFALRCLYARRRWRGRIPVGPEKEPNGILEYETYSNGKDNSRSSVKDDYDPEFGMRRSNMDDALDTFDPWDPHAGTWRDTIIGTDAGEANSLHTSYIQVPDLEPSSPHSGLSVMSALLTGHDRNDSQTSDLAEFGMDAVGMAGVGMAGVGTAARGSIIDTGLQLDRPSFDSTKSSTPLRMTVSSLRSSYMLAPLSESDSAPDVHQS